MKFFRDRAALRRKHMPGKPEQGQERIDLKMSTLMKNMTADRLAQYFDHTQLRPFAVKEDFIKLCEECKKYHFRMAAINPAPVVLCKQLLQGTDIHVGAAISFPLGQSTYQTKLFETKEAIDNGADEIDYVIDIRALKEKRYADIEKEMSGIVDICRSSRVLSKVIFENCYLTESDKKELCHIACNIKPDYIKTSTGFGTGGASADDVRLMKSIVKDEVKIKAAGGIRSLQDAERMLEAGAERIGSTMSVTIMEEYRNQ